MTIDNAFQKSLSGVLDFKFDWRAKTNGTTGDEEVQDWLSVGETISAYQITVDNSISTGGSTVRLAFDSGANSLNAMYTPSVVLGGSDDRAYFSGSPVNAYVDIYSVPLNTLFDGRKVTAVVRGKVKSAATSWLDSNNHILLAIYTSPFGNDITIDIGTDGLLEWTMMTGGFPGIIKRQVSVSDLDWMTLGLTISQTAGELCAYKDGLQQGAPVTAGMSWSNPLWVNGCFIGGPNWIGWASDCIISFGVVATPVQMLDIYTKLDSGILTSTDLDIIFGIDNYAGWKLDEDSGINIDSSSKTDSDTSITVWLSGGEIFKNYKVSCRITTSASRTDERSIIVSVVDR